MGDDRKILGQYRRHYALCRPDGQIGSTTVVWVLVAGEVGDYAAYEGVGDVQSVARFGEKIAFEDACRIWPDLEPTRYRS